MSTRGAYGFRVDGKDFVTYNHSDSYPSWLGQRIVDFVFESAAALVALRDRVRRIELVTGEDAYAKLRDHQGDLRKSVMSGLMLDYADFLEDSLFCEFAYIINLDEATLEFYKGFNTNPAAPGRYANAEGSGGYYGVALVGTLDLDAIPSDWAERFYDADCL